jgi:hypothetical protein
MGNRDLCHIGSVERRRCDGDRLINRAVVAAHQRKGTTMSTNIGAIATAGVIGVGTIIFGIAGFVAIASYADSTPSTPVAVSACKADWHQCADLEDYVKNHDVALIQVRCKRAANESAKYGTPQWPTGLSFKQSYDFQTDVKTGRLVLGEDRAQFQNGFGVMAHNNLVCEYDLNQDRVTDIRTE